MIVGHIIFILKRHFSTFFTFYTHTLWYKHINNNIIPLETKKLGGYYFPLIKSHYAIENILK